MHRSILFLLLLCLVNPLSAGESMIRFLMQGAVIEGSPLLWEKQFGAVLARDGKWINLDPTKIENLRTVSNSFRPYSTNDLRGLLQQEFGTKFDVAGDVHYLVVFPKGQRDTWAPRFEQLFRSFQQYFTARGWRPQEPKFPLIAVVFPTEREFHAYAQREGSKISNNTLGYYSPLSNRILLFDATNGKNHDWSLNAETIIHEAAHQTAFNTGVHNRFAHPSRWIVEGLGTMFEAKGVWNSSQFRNQSDRINRARFTAFQRYEKSRRQTGALAELVSSDRFFDSDTDGAYAEAWSLTFFLSETDPRRYIEYLRKTAAQPNFTQRRGPERLADFTSVFGDNLKLLEAKMLRFIGDLK